MTNQHDTDHDFEVGDIVKLKGGEFAHETFKVKRVDYADGSIGVWGGSKRADGYRSARNFMPARLIHETRKEMLQSWGRPSKKEINRSS
jgi:hypothetical protein